MTGTLVVGEVDVHISKLTVTGHRELDPTTVPPADGSAIIQPGDVVKDAALVDQDGKTRRLSEWRGHRLALTFVYTRCPLPEFCPLMNQHFRSRAEHDRENAGARPTCACSACRWTRRTTRRRC